MSPVSRSDREPLIESLPPNDRGRLSRHLHEGRRT